MGPKSILPLPSNKGTLSQVWLAQSGCASCRVSPSFPPPAAPGRRPTAAPFPGLPGEAPPTGGFPGLGGWWRVRVSRRRSLSIPATPGGGAPPLTLGGRPRGRGAEPLQLAPRSHLCPLHGAAVRGPTLPPCLTDGLRRRGLSLRAAGAVPTTPDASGRFGARFTCVRSARRGKRGAG